MGQQIEVGRIAGLPVVLDGTFVLLVLALGWPALSTAEAVNASIGALVAAGVICSIVLHEFGHAVAARACGMDVSHIELSGFGGLCYFASSRPLRPLEDIVICAAGPAVNLLLFAGSIVAVDVMSGSVLSVQPSVGWHRLAIVVDAIGAANFWMLCFNLLPAHPLDGGRIAGRIVERFAGKERSSVIVGWLGIMVCAVLAVWVVQHDHRFGLLPLIVLFMHNRFAIDRGT